ncbi:MAG: (d)CMP kinase [Proteobacteria bacterium]|nr:(d)CMP kinase [Pseudomonadota bacterium]
MSVEFIPVITIDGPSGCGKGTIAQKLAKHLHWHWLDSGALYRILAWAVLHYQVAPSHDQELAKLIKRLKITFTADSEGSAAQMSCDGHDVSHTIRTEACAKMASEISAKPFVRAALLQMQRDLRQPPGLVADGRDMGTVVFTDAVTKFFLTATAEERARRRHHQLQKLGILASYPQIYNDLVIRDERDRNRPVAPLQAAGDAIVIDTTHLTIEEVFSKILNRL